MDGFCTLRTWPALAGLILALATGTATGTMVVVVQMETDLAVAQTPVPSPVVSGAPLTYGITVTNMGQAAARDVRVEDRLPAGSVFVSATGTGWGCIEAGGVVSCYRDALAAGAAAPISLVVTAPASCDILSNQVAVTAGTPDGDADNNVSVAATPCAVPTYALKLNKAGTGWGTVSGGGTFATGAPVTLNATAEPGSTFLAWSGDCTGAS